MAAGRGGTRPGVLAVAAPEPEDREQERREEDLQPDDHQRRGQNGQAFLGEVAEAALGLCARAYGVYVLGERDSLFERWRPRLRLEHGLLAGTALLVAGLVLGGVIVGKWIERGGGQLSEARLGLLAATLVIVGLQVFFSSFLLSIMGLRAADR